MSPHGSGPSKDIGYCRCIQLDHSVVQVMPQMACATKSDDNGISPLVWTGDTMKVDLK